MNKTSFYIVSSLAALLMTVASCEKEDATTPIIENSCTSCPCIEFDGISINKSVTSTTYSAAFFYQNDVFLQGKYIDHSVQGQNTGSIEVIPLTLALQSQNANFSGDVLRVSDANVLFDCTNSNGPKLKVISFDWNSPPRNRTFDVNGLSPFGTNNLRVNFSNVLGTYNYEVIGNVRTIELGGEEAIIDNFCISDYKPMANTVFDTIAISFRDSVLNLDVTAIDVAFTSTHQAPIQTSHQPSHQNVYVGFRHRYADYTGTGSDGNVFFGASASAGADFNNHFFGNLLRVHNCDLEADFSNVGFTNKHVSFDISNNWAIASLNEFEVNGTPLGTIPTGFSYYMIPLGNANNGNPCYRVVIEGPINTIILKGNNTFYDNLAVEPI